MTRTKIGINELSIGNFLMVQGDAGFYRVTAIDGVGLKVNIYRAEYEWHNLFDDKDFYPDKPNPKKSRIRPIRITTEWIEKFNLAKTDWGYRFIDIESPKEHGRWIEYESFLGNKKLKYPFLRFDGITEVKFVHQLQNLYQTFTGRELEMKLDD